MGTSGALVSGNRTDLLLLKDTLELGLLGLRVLREVHGSACKCKWCYAPALAEPRLSFSTPMRAPAWLATLGTLVGLLLPARADTEIVNFRTADSASAFALPFATGWWAARIERSHTRLRMCPGRPLCQIPSPL